MIKRIINRMIVIGKNNPTKSENSQLNSSQTIGQKVQFNNFKYKQNKNDVVNTVTDVEIKDYMLDKSNNATADNMYATAEDLGIFLSSTICKTMLLQIQICVFGILTNITAFFRVYSWHCYLSMLIVLRLYANCLVLTRENCEKIQNVLNDGIHGHIRGDYMNYTLTELHNAYQIVKNKKVDIKQIQNMNPDTTNNAANTNAANTNAAKGGYDQHGGIVNLFQSAPYQPVRELFLSVCIENQNKNGDESIIFKDEDSKAGMFKSDSIIGTIERIRYIQNCIDIKKNAYMIWGSVLRKSKNLQNAELMNNISGSDDNDNKNTNSTEVADAIDIDPSIIEKVPLGDVYYEYVRIKTTDVASSVFSGKHVGVENINEILGPTQKKNTYLATIKPLIKYEKTKTNGKYNVITLKDIQTQVMSKKQNLERAPYFRPIVIPDPSSVDIDEWNAWKENNNKWYVSLEDVYGDNYYMYDDVLGKIYGYYEKYTNMFGIEIYIHCEFSTQRAGGYETITQGKDGNGESHDVSNKYKVDNNESSSSSSDNTNNTNTNANGDEDVVSQENAPVVPNRQATHFKLFQVSPHKNYEILQKILSSLKKLTANEIQKTLGEASQTESDSDVNIMIPDTSEEYAKYITEQAQLLINKQNNESKGNSTT
jgi:hypothetical protein